MNKQELERILERELDRWCAKPYQALIAELEDTVNYEGREGAASYQVEVLMLERTPERVHVSLAVDDGGWRAFIPLSTDFLVYRDGRVDRP
jgi:hypothetical protein